MPPDDSQGRQADSKYTKHICPQCGFDNHSFAVYCEICFYPLEIAKSSTSTPPIIQPQTVEVENSSATSWQQELKKPSVTSGLAVLTLLIALWINYLLSLKPNELAASKTNTGFALYDSMSQVENVPRGLFNYGGALYFASLVAHGLNNAIAQSHPHFSLRYTKPRNQDQSYANAMQMLLDGELSFAFNGRALTEPEYSQAKLRGIDLQQIPIAIDGIVVFGNQATTIAGLSLDQVRDIFTGKINNWKQLGGENLPIIPVLLTPENLEILGLNSQDLAHLPATTQYASNYTLALRQVIAHPGAISLTSASLVQDQQLIKVFNLAESNSTNYIAPFTAQKPNLSLFKNGTYPLTRRLFLVVRQDGTPDQLAGKAYAEMLLSNQGQTIIKQSGFVPLYSE